MPSFVFLPKRARFVSIAQLYHLFYVFQPPNGFNRFIVRDNVLFIRSQLSFGFTIIRIFVSQFVSDDRFKA